MMSSVNGIPIIGLGTWNLTGQDGRRAIAQAIELGYRHIDTAQMYDTETNVGLAIRESGLDRKEFFVTTKISGSNLSRIAESIRDSMRVMELEYLDLVLIHWPPVDDVPPLPAYMGDLARLQDLGRTRMIGVSNFTRQLIDRSIAEIGPARIATNQVERHLRLQNQLLSDHCQAHGIAITAYQPLGGGDLGDRRALEKIGAKHNATAEQVALAFLMQQRCIVIPKSASAQRQESNLKAVSVKLDDTDMAVLRGLERGERHVDPKDTAPEWD